MKYGLKDETVDAIKAVFAQFSAIDKVILYGSRAKGDFKPGSDIDLTILENGLSTTDLLRLENQLDDLLLPYTFDLSLYRQLSHVDLLEHILRVGLPFYTRSNGADRGEAINSAPLHRPTV